MACRRCTNPTPCGITNSACAPTGSATPPHAHITAFYDRYKNPIIEEAIQGIPLNYDVNVSGAINPCLDKSAAGLVLRRAIAGVSGRYATKRFMSFSLAPDRCGHQKTGVKTYLHFLVKAAWTGAAACCGQ